MVGGIESQVKRDIMNKLSDFYRVSNRMKRIIKNVHSLLQ